MAKNDIVAGTYGHVLKHWHAASMGPKPNAELFIQAHALGCRPGKQALARALELRAGGATDGQIKAACIAQWGNSGSHHNKRGELSAAKLVTVTKTKPGQHTVYAIALTPKGVERVKAGEAPAVVVETKAKARKGAGKGKAKPAKPEPVTEAPDAGMTPSPVEAVAAIAAAAEAPAA